jgi:hypothetical protein
MLLKLVMIVAIVSILLASGICPLTIQLALLGVLFLALVRKSRDVVEKYESEAAGVTMTDGVVREDYTKLPKREALVVHLSYMAGPLKDAKTIHDPVSNSAWTLETPNSTTDSIVLRNKITGMTSQQAGVFEDFTIITTLTLPLNGTVSLFKVHGMKSGALSKIELAVQPGPEAKRQIQLSCGSSAVTANVSATASPVTIVAMRKGNRVTINQIIHGITPTVDAHEGDLSDDSRMTPEVTTPVELASGGVSGGDAYLKRLIVWSAPLTSDEISAVIKRAWVVEILKDPVVARIIQDEEAASANAANAKTKNPYGSEVIQNTCSAIKDWTLPDALAMADEACWNSISAHCSANPTSPGCKCWDPALSLTASCVNFRAQLSGKPPPNLSALTPAQLEQVKHVYGLGNHHHHKHQHQHRRSHNHPVFGDPGDDSDVWIEDSQPKHRTRKGVDTEWKWWHALVGR